MNNAENVLGNVEEQVESTAAVEATENTVPETPEVVPADSADVVEDVVKPENSDTTTVAPQENKVEDSKPENTVTNNQKSNDQKNKKNKKDRYQPDKDGYLPDIVETKVESSTQPVVSEKPVEKRETRIDEGVRLKRGEYVVVLGKPMNNDNECDKYVIEFQRRAGVKNEMMYLPSGNQKVIAFAYSMGYQQALTLRKYILSKGMKSSIITSEKAASMSNN